MKLQHRLILAGIVAFVLIEITGAAAALAAISHLVWVAS